MVDKSWGLAVAEEMTGLGCVSAGWNVLALSSGGASYARTVKEGLRDRVVDGPAREADDRLWAGRGGVLATSTWGS